MIRFKCPGCGHLLQTQPAAAGKKVKCGKCQTMMMVPQAKPKLTAQPQQLAAAKSQAARPPQAATAKQKATKTTTAAQTKPRAKAAGKPRAATPRQPLTKATGTPSQAAGSGAFDGLPDFAAPAPRPAVDPLAAPDPLAAAAADPLARQSGAVDFGDVLNSATASIDAAVQSQLQRNAYAVGAKLTTKQIAASFGKQIEPIERSERYGRSLAMVATTMLVLPALFVGLVTIGTLVMAYVCLRWFGSESTGELLHPLIFFGAIAIIVLLLAAWIPVINMVFAALSMLFSGRHLPPGTWQLKREEQPVMYAFVEQICEKLNAPKPKRIDLNCDYNASASFDGGFLGFQKNQLVLTIGVPLIASHSAEQLASVIAHEFGHFCQGGGMRAHYLIRNLNGWFIHAAIEKTIRDEVDAYIRQNSEFGAGFIWAISYVIGFLGRHMMWWFGFAGHAISGVLSREMEYDADKYAVHLAGSKAFTESMTTVEKYGVAYAVTIDNLRMLFQQGVLVDNIPRLMMHIGKTMPGSVVRKIAEASEKEKQRAFDTHPPTRDRLRAAKQLGKTGIVRVGRPSTDLIDHWNDLCQLITLVFYSQVTGQKILPEHVTKLEDILAAEHKLLLDKA